MLDQEDLKWLAANTHELNRLLQQASRSSEQARQHKEDRYLEALGEEVAQAARTSQAVLDRVTARMVPGTSRVARPPSELREKIPASASRPTALPAGEVVIPEVETNEPPIRNPHGQRELILLVDDDKEILERTGDILDFEDYRVVMATDGIEALGIYRRMGRKIGLVLLDYFLPVMDGDAVFDELKAIDPQVRVVLSSGFGEQAKVGSMLARGLCGFIPKPYTHEKLVEQLRSVLDA
ncbi:MAG: response regulator [Verrucomicrobiota bacterium]|nr:response regulator [Verrucomicrobiota bacterium]